MTTSRFTCPAALLCAFVVVSLATSGCASMGGATDKWATAWKKGTEPKPADPNHEEIVTYWGQKKKEPKPTEMPPELKERLAKTTDQSQKARDYADNLKAGNLRYKEGRWEEARRAYELALAAKPDDPDVHHRLAVVADKQQLFGAADDHYEAALRKRPRDPNLLSDIGYSHILRGDEQRAETTLREALAIDPSHKGAMLNLSTLYGRQGRYDDALALLRKGTTEAETQQYLAQLFPQGRPSDVALAANQAEAGSRSVRPIPTDERTNVKTMTTEQRKAEWERRQLEGNQNRPPQSGQSPSQRDGSGDSPRQDQRPSIAPNQPAWTQGQAPGFQLTNPPQTANPGFGQAPPNSSQMQAGAAMQPGATTIPMPPNLQPGLPNLQLGSPMLPYPGNSPNGTAQQFQQQGQQPQQQGFAAAPPLGSLVAPPGTSPHANMDFWQGAPVQPNAGAGNPTLPQFQFSPQSQFQAEQLGQSQGGAAGGVSPSQAAAQLGMSAGPGSMFPIVGSDSVSAGGMNIPQSGTPHQDQRFGSGFAQPPQYPAPNNQFAPTNVPNQGGFQLPRNDGSASDQFLQNWGGAASSRSNGAVQQASAGSDMTISPFSPASNTSSPWDTPSNVQLPNLNMGSGVIQAGGSSGWNQPAPRGSDSPDANQSDTSGGGTSRYAKTPWPDPMSQPSGSRPYNGAWPNNSQPNAANSGSGSAPNSLPMWNGGNAAGASMQGGAGSSPNSSPQQWPYSSQR